MEYGLKKKGYDQARGKCRVNIGEAFQRWRDLRELLGLKLDADVALFLLDRCATLVYYVSHSQSVNIVLSHLPMFVINNPNW